MSLHKIKHEVATCTSSKDSLQLFYDEERDKYTGYCFSCAAEGLPAYVENPFKQGEEPPKPKVKTEEEIFEELQEIRSLTPPTFAHRSIPAEYFKRSGVKVALSEYDGKTPFTFNFPHSKGGKLCSYKSMMLAKKAMWSVGCAKECDLYNWEVAKKKGTKRLYITEGHWDCHALEYMLEKSSGGKYKYAVTSVPDGVGSAAPTIARQYKEITNIFDEVVLVFDNDDAGRGAVKDVQKVMPDVKEVPYPTSAKDANEALINGDSAIFADFALWKVRKPLIEGVLSVSEIVAAGVPEPETGYSYPWYTVDKITYGKRMGEATCYAGGVGCGKTLICHEDVAHNITEHKEPSFVALLEEANHKTLWNVSAKIDSIPYNRPEVFKANREQYYDTVKQLESKLFLWNSSGNTAYRFDLAEIIKAIRFNALEYGVKFAYIDNMTRIVDQFPTAEANEFINKYSSELANLASELDIHISLFSHLNPPRGKDVKSHEQGGEVFASQLTGSRGIMRSFPNIIGFERNKHAEGSDADRSYISILKNRDYGNEQKVKTLYDPSTSRLMEYNWDGDNL